MPVWKYVFHASSKNRAKANKQTNKHLDAGVFLRTFSFLLKIRGDGSVHKGLATQARSSEFKSPAPV